MIKEKEIWRALVVEMNISIKYKLELFREKMLQQTISDQYWRRSIPNLLICCHLRDGRYIVRRISIITAGLRAGSCNIHYANVCQWTLLNILHHG